MNNDKNLKNSQIIYNYLIILTLEIKLLLFLILKRHIFHYFCIKN